MSENDDRIDDAKDPEGDASASGVPGTLSTPTGESGDNARPRELGGRKGPEPTRYGDWEKKGRCIDF